MALGRFTGGKLFQKGVSGNPGGRPKGNPEVKRIFREHSEEAALKIVELLNCGEKKFELMAAQEILNRTEGKPTETVKMNVSGHVSVRSQIRDIFKEHLRHGNTDANSESGNEPDTDAAGTDGAELTD